MNKVLLTGAKGFVGPYLAAHLIDQGMKVVGFDIRDGQDVRDYESVRVAVEANDPDYIVHLAAPAYVPETTTDPRRGFDVIVGGTMNVLEAVRHSGSRANVLLAGSSEEVGYDCYVLSEDTVASPTTPYGVAKLSAGQLGLVYARLYGMRVVVTRAFNHTGPGHPAMYAVPSFAKRVAEFEAGKIDVVRHGNLSARRCYADVRDVIRAYRLAMELPTGIYNICSDEIVSMKDVMHHLIAQVKVRVVTELDPSLNRPASDHFPIPDRSKFSDMTGWEPEIPFSRTLDDTLDYWRQRI